VGHSPGYLVARAEEANRLLNGDVCKEAFDMAEAAFVKEWRAADTTARREICWAKIAGLDEVRHQLRRVISQGEHVSLSSDREG
jgi:hypothetical protein